MCFEADTLFFQLKTKQNDKEIEALDLEQKVISIYEESVQLGNTKAMMALGSIYEQGSLKSCKLDLLKAYHFFDMASMKEPYALYWLGLAYEVISFSQIF